MPRIGLLCDRAGEEEGIIHTVELLAAREGFGCSVYSLRRELEKDGAMPRKGDLPGPGAGLQKGGTPGKGDIPWEEIPGKDITCVILDWEDRGRAFRYAEALWAREPSLLVIYVAHKVEDIVAALGMPFFHIARRFGLEQDLEAAFRKLDKIRLSAPDRVKFTQNGQTMLIPSREILYVESEHHEIRLHLIKEVLQIKENLAQCEDKLKGRGFVRTYRSFLVNMYHIRCLEKESALLGNGERLYVSRRKHPEVKLAFENYIRHLDFL